MKKALVCVVCFLCISFQAQADNALGVIVGDPTGFSGRFGLDNGHSLDTAIAFSTGYYEGLYIHGTYLWDRARTFETAADPLELYYGLGARIVTIQRGRYDGDVALGPRAPIGLLYNFKNPDVEVFGEVSATLDITPRTDVDIDAALGVRVRF